MDVLSLQTIAAQSPVFFYSAVVVFGLCAGSFLNVVIARLPMMLEASWRAEAADVLDQPAADARPAVTLARPRSRCPRCDTPIRARDNIPVLGFIVRRGRCAACRGPISWQYPLVEIAAAVLAVVAFLRFGITPWAAETLIFAWLLLTLAVIDWHHGLLPDVLTLALLWLGLLASLGHGPGGAGIAPGSAVFGAALGYGALWLLFQLFRLATGKHGMGYGDFKLLAAIGAWVGAAGLPLTLLLASIAGAVIGGALMAVGRVQRDQGIPFGPWLAIAGWLTLIAGDTILRSYLTISGLR